MDKPLTQAVLESGLVDSDTLTQLVRWRMLSADEVEDYAKNLANTPDSIVQKIHTALDSGDAVEVRDTDPDVIAHFLQTRRKAKLHVPNPDAEGKTLGIPVEYSVNKMGEYLIPWTSEGIRDLMLDELTYIKPVGEPRVYFADVRELFYGDHKAFMVCTPAEK
jgi:hypothetical protein